MWQIELTDSYERDLKRFAKKHRKELEAVLTNLQRYLDMLNQAKHPQLIAAGFLHAEPKGVVAVDQKGKAVAQTRLYTLPEFETCILYLIKIGDKDSQKDDISICTAFAESVRDPGPQPE